MSLAAGTRVEFETPRGDRAVGSVVDELAEGAFNSSPQTVFVVDAGDTSYRVPEDDTEFC